jgi:glycosyltransferase involved in cell wall biosynthesis
MNIKLSAVIITYNEEKNLERCILSLLHVADEIIVVDSFSTDKTKKIAAKLKVKFIENEFKGHIQQKKLCYY